MSERNVRYEREEERLRTLYYKLADAYGPYSDTAMAALSEWQQAANRYFEDRNKRRNER